MDNRGRLVVAAVSVGVLAAVATQWSGCGSDNAVPVTFQGDVSTVTGATAKARARSKFLAAVDQLLAAKALAQGQCQAEHLLICVGPGESQATPTATTTATATATSTATTTPTGTPATPVPTRTQTPEGGPTATRCARVNSDTCGFSLEVEVPEANDEVQIFFVDDEDGDGQFDDGENTAILQNPIGGVCNGDVYTLDNVDVDFDSGTAEAEFVDQEVDACAPTPGATRTRTRTPTGTGTPATATPSRTPTVTGTPPTATPTVTGTPPTVTPTATVTETPGPPTPTSTPCADCAGAPCCDTCVEGVCVPV